MGVLTRGALYYIWSILGPILGFWGTLLGISCPNPGSSLYVGRFKLALVYLGVQ